MTTPTDAAADDHALLARFAAERDEDAFAALVRRHGDLVHGVCRRVLGDAQAADDAAQAVFLVLMRKPRSIPTRTPLAAWLHVCARQAALAQRRAQRRRERREREAARSARGVAAEAAAITGLDDAIASLPRMQRASLVLRYLEGRSQAEAAAELGCAPETVHTHVTRALARLRARLAGPRGALGANALLAALAAARAHAAPEGFAVAHAGAGAGAQAVALADAVARAQTWSALATAGACAAGVGTLALAASLVVAAHRAAPPPAPVVSATTTIAAPPVTAPITPIATMRGADLGVAGLAVAADGTIVTASWDRTVRAFAADGRAAGTGRDHHDGLRAAAVSHDGARAVTTGNDGLGIVWHLPDLAPIARLDHGGEVLTAAFAPDGSLATSGMDGLVRRWSATGAPLATWSGHDGAVWAVAFSPDGALLASASDDRRVLLRDARDGSVRGELRGHVDCLRDVAFSPDGRLLLSGSNDRTARLWDIATRTQRRVLAHPDLVVSVAFAPDGRRCATACGDGVRLWRVDMDAVAIVVPDVQALRVAFAPDGTLLTGDREGMVRRWDAPRLLPLTEKPR